MRPFLIRELKKQRGVKPEEAIRMSLPPAKQDQFDRSLRSNGGDLESAIDVNDFPRIVQRNRDAFQSCYDRNPAFLSKLWDVVEGRNTVAHPGNQDLDQEFVRTRLSIVVEALGIVGATVPQSQVEKVRDRLLGPDSRAVRVPLPQAEPAYEATANKGTPTTMTALERFEQAFGSSYCRKHYNALRIRTGATIYFSRGPKNRDVVHINLQYVWNFPNAHSLVGYLNGTPDNGRDYCIGPEHWERVIQLIRK